MKKHFIRPLLLLSSSLFLMTALGNHPLHASTESILLEAEKTATQKPCFVLALDGGGARGLLTTIVLRSLEKDLNEGIEPTNANYRPLGTFFDIIVGTSTGSIIGSALATQKTAHGLVEMYEANLSRIFSASFCSKLASCWGLIGPRYSLSNLESILKANTQNCWLSEIRNLKGVASSPRLLLTSYDLTTEEAFNFDSAKAASNPQEDYLLSDAVLSSCAQPVAFKPAVIKNAKGETRYCADTGISVNPVMVGVNTTIQSLKEQGKSDDFIYNSTKKNIKVVSLGTGFFKQKIDPKKMEKWGALQWVIPELNGPLGGLRSQYTQLSQGLGFAEVHRLDIKLDSSSELEDDDISATILQSFRDKAAEIIRSTEYAYALEMLKSTLRKK